MTNTRCRSWSTRSRVLRVAGVGGDGARRAHRRTARYPPRPAPRAGAPLVLPLSTHDRGGATPLFCVVGGGAPASQIHAFADAMEHRPVYGIRQRGLEETRPSRPDRVGVCTSQRSARYARSSRRARTSSAVTRTDALVAFEMACELVEAERGSRPPRDHRRARGRRGPAQRRCAPQPGIAQFAHKQRCCRLKRVVPPGEDDDARARPRRGLEQYDAFYVLGLNIGRKYDRPGQCAAPTLVVRARDVEYFADPAKALPDLGWAPGSAVR